MSARRLLVATDEAETIGQRIRKARKVLGLNQGALAERLGVTQPTVANWEAGVHDPRQLMLVKLADALAVSLGWLAGGEPLAESTERTPTAAYLRRPIHHVPVVTPESLMRLSGGLDPNDAAMDWFPIAHEDGRLVAVFLSGETVAPTLGSEALFVIDTDRAHPRPGDVAVLQEGGLPIARRWTEGQAGRVLGTAIASIRFH